MEIKTLYKVFSGETAEIEHVLNTLSRDGWRPVTMSCRSNLLTVILENKVMEEAKLNFTSTGNQYRNPFLTQLNLEDMYSAVNNI